MSTGRSSSSDIVPKSSWKVNFEALGPEAKVRNFFFRRPFVLDLGPKKLMYHFFGLDQSIGKRPIIILNPFIFGIELLTPLIQKLRKSCPVYVVDMPGRGGNFDQQILTPLEESLLLREFCARLLLEKIDLVGISFSAPTAQVYALNNPRNIARLVLGGSVLQMRPSVHYTLFEDISLDLPINEAIYCLSTSMVNFGMREKITDGKKVQANLFDSIRKVVKTPLQLEKAMGIVKSFLAHSGRAIFPSCETLVVTGQFDHITTPYENFEYALNLPRAVVAIFKGCDHLGVMEKNEEFSNLVDFFLRGDRLNETEDVIIYRRSAGPSINMRITSRIGLNQPSLLKGHNGVRNVRLIEIGPRGFKVEGDFRDFRYHPSEELYLQISSQSILVKISILHMGPGILCGVFSGANSLERLKIDSFLNYIDGMDKLGA